MAKFKFSRCPRRRRIKFFQSSPRYLNNNAATFYEQGQTRTWSSEEPQSSDHKILTFTNGHYGIYFSLFNHELRKKENGYCLDDKRSILVVLPQAKTVDSMPEFRISKAKQKIHSDIDHIKSTLSAIGSTGPLKAILPARNFSTTTKAFYASHAKLTASQNRSSAAAPKQNSALEDNSVEEEDHFNSTFAKTQSDAIIQTFQSHTDGSQLNVIFPLYQSLKRNGLLLPSIHEYNIVMKSIALRSLDSESTLQAIESKLTCLLTVYEDVLRACASNLEYKPNTETYDVILSSMFESIEKAINLASHHCISQNSFHKIVEKTHEFTVVAMRLLLSVNTNQDIPWCHIFPSVLSSLNFFPNCINVDIANYIVSLKDQKEQSPAFYSEMILVAKHISKPHLLNMSKRETYDFITTLYANFKESITIETISKSNEYQIYCALVESLIIGDNLPVATKFVDQILESFKENRHTGKTHSENMKGMSALLSKYIDCMILSGKEADLERAYSLVSKFGQLSYLPELNVKTHGNMIKAQIHRYIAKELEKSKNPSEKVSIENSQRDIYEQILEHYNFISIRNDFQESVNIPDHNFNGFLEISCREALLSFALDIGDHSTVSRLLKEVLLKDSIIRDWNISKKTCQYLLSGALVHSNQYYENVMWSFVEQQASHYKANTVELHNFLSEHSDILLHETPNTASKVLNSLMIFNSMKSYTIEKSNWYGIASVMRFLMNKIPGKTSYEAFKILQYQSLLIQELEDTDNHYVELSPQLTELKPLLTRSFLKLLENAPPNTPRSEDINRALAMVGDKDAQFEATQNLSSADYTVDLSTQLMVNYQVGTKMFLSHFKDGYNFSAETISAIISRKFVFDVLESEKPIKVHEFLRIFCPDSEATSEHFASLVSLGNEKINLKILDCLSKGSYEHLLRSEKVLESLAHFASRTENQQYLKKFAENFHRFKSTCPHKHWMVVFLRKLLQTERYDEASALLKQDYAFFAGDLNAQKKVDQQLLKVVFDVFLQNQELDMVNQIFKEKFSGVEGNKRLLGSESLLTCLVDYYTRLGSFNTILQQLSGLPVKSSVLRQKIRFARYLAQLEGTEVCLNESTLETSQDLIIAMISENNILRMRDIYMNNSHLVRSKDKFFRDMVETLNQAASYSSSKHYSAIRSKFESVIKLCKAINLTGLSTTTLLSIIKLLATTKSTDLLHILFNKFNNNNTLVSSLNFFFLHIEIKSVKEAAKVLQSFKDALNQVDDTINLAVLRQQEQLGMSNE